MQRNFGVSTVRLTLDQVFCLRIVFCLFSNRFKKVRNFTEIVVGKDKKRRLFLKARSGENSVSELSDHKSEVSVVYFRSGYGPSDYPTGEERKKEGGKTTEIPKETEWETRTMIELSYAVKVWLFVWSCSCLIFWQIPTVSWQLAGTKKVQQILSDKKILAKFV